MRRRVLAHYRAEAAPPPGQRKSKLEPNGKCGGAVKQQQLKQQQASEPPVEAMGNPLQFLEHQSSDKLVVHWTRAESSQFSSIKLLPPW